MTTPLACAVCRVPANLKCSGCKNVVYCGKDHQKEHWRKGHKGQCKCFELATNEILGRYLRASRDIKKGEIILRENPFIFGPKITSYPICLGCHQFVTLEPGQKNLYRCSGCTWPMCGPKCEKLKNHIDECELMTQKNFKCSLNGQGTDQKQSSYCVILPLRCMLMKRKNPENYQKILDLEDHLEERLNTPIYNVLKANLVTFIKTILRLEDFDETEILRIAAILDTNAFEIRLPSKNIKIRALFPLAAMVSHNCVPNTRHVFDDNMQLIFISTVDIPKGSVIFTSYTQGLKSTLQRRELLRLAKCFDCTCERCQDPTEFDTFLGAICCSKCKIGKIISTDPLDDSAPWKCQICSHEIPIKQIIWGNNTIAKEIESVDKNSPRQFEELLIKYRDTLHEKNTHVIQIKYALIQLYGNIKGFYLHELTDAGVKRKIDLCLELLEIADIFEPGWTRFRGVLLLDLQEIMAVQTKREFNQQLITKEATQEKLIECMTILQEAVEILKLEPGTEQMLQERVSALAREIEME